jgi:hypothetical protein
VPTPFTAKQGQYLAFIYYYSKIHSIPPAEADFQRFFRVTPPCLGAFAPPRNLPSTTNNQRESVFKTVGVSSMF